MKHFPRSLFARTALTLALAFIVFQVAAFWVVTRTLIVPVAERSADDLAGLIVLSAQTWVELPPETRAAFERELARRHGLRLTTIDVGATAAAPRFAFRKQIETALSRRVGEQIVLRGVPESAAVWLDIPVGGHALRVGFFPDRYAVKLPLAAIAVVVLGTLLGLLTALFLVRRLTVPLARAAQAARQVGAGELPEPLPETGPAELAELARRFNTMAAEVRALLDNRTTLLAGISHDLRTPMTRLQLHLEMLRDAPSPARIDRAVADLADMNKLITGYLELARTTQPEQKTRFDLAGLLEEVAADTNLPWPGAAPCEVEAGRLAVRQIVSNLVQNAQRYGGGAPVELALECGDKRARVIVRDAGVGIPEDQLEKVFRPFYRLEGSRSQATGGTGLGLAIVRQLAETNGCRVTLRNRTAGGLEAVLELPR
ncbi:MAG: HAMP domain-containing protein [Gammaproteobacteria bacterium]|nr:HAMP domain-containing protein [Gammaproteobacteria bacterium]MBU1408394.1 HAMP domain-containing protein [Gammaproteobacteria bacterium]MBU1532206.1 HAMP domain-containing protein [Gammaproteobacteria bacterium]